MVDNSFNPQLYCLEVLNETMDSYIEQSKMQLLVTWATEIEIIATVLLLQTTIHVYGPCGKINYDKFKKRVSSYTGASYNLVKENELMKICHVTLCMCLVASILLWMDQILMTYANGYIAVTRKLLLRTYWNKVSIRTGSYHKTLPLMKCTHNMLCTLQSTKQLLDPCLVHILLLAHAANFPVKIIVHETWLKCKCATYIKFFIILNSFISLHASSTLHNRNRLGDP